MKIFKSKKGMDTKDFIWAMIFTVVLGFVAMFMVFIFAKSGSKQVQIPENVNINALIQRFQNSPECFIYNREDIVLTGVIDIVKFNDGFLNSCYIADDKQPAFRIILNSPELTIPDPIKTKNWNQNRGFERKISPYPTTIYSNGGEYDGEVVIEIQNV